MKRFTQYIIGIIIFISIFDWGLSQTTGCMDNGYQLWSPIYGSPACNYNPDAIIEGECFYIDCTGECGGSAIVDNCGICQGNNSPNTGNCDCAGIPNGLAYINPFCTNVCVGGDSGLSDCVNLFFPDTLIASHEITDIQIYAENIDTLKSLEIEFYYKNVFEINDFSIYGTDLSEFYPNKYILEHFSEEIVSDTMRTILSMYFNPSSSADTMFYSKDTSNIFNIKLKIIDNVSSGGAQLIINSLIINENSMSSNNWSPEIIWVDGTTSCTDVLACNYNPDSLGECWYNSPECVCTDGEGAMADECDTCDNDPENDCTQDCTGAWCIEGSEGCLTGTYPDVDNEGTDNCGICGGDNSSCVDCYGVPYGSAILDDCGICSGGLTENEPCIPDCNDELGGTAYNDGCNNCVGGGTNESDCLYASINIIDSQGTQIQDSVSQLTDTVIVALHMEHLPVQLEGLDLKIEFDSEIISFNGWGISSVELDTNLSITGIFEDFNDYYEFEVGVENASTFSASVFLTGDTTSVSSLDKIGNILFLKFTQNAFQDSTLLGTYTALNYHFIQINENEIPDINSTSLLLEIITLSNNSNRTLPKSYFLSQNFPNPFNPTTSIEYFVPYYDDINIEIINIQGRVVKDLIDTSHQPGNYQIIWDGTNNNGFSSPAGIYFYKMKATDFYSVKKLILLK